MHQSMVGLDAAAPADLVELLAPLCRCLRRSGLHLVHSRNRTVDPRSNPIPPLGFVLADKKDRSLQSSLWLMRKVGGSRSNYTCQLRWRHEKVTPVFGTGTLRRCGFVQNGIIPSIFFVWLKNVYGTEPFHFWFGLRFCVEQNYSIYCLVRHNTTSLIQDFDKYIVLKVVSSQILGRHESLIALP
jgi:hypothetical protein